MSLTLKGLIYHMQGLEIATETERQIAVKNGTLNDFIRKWDLFQHREVQ